MKKLGTLVLLLISTIVHAQLPPPRPIPLPPAYSTDELIVRQVQRLNNLILNKQLHTRLDVQSKYIILEQLRIAADSVKNGSAINPNPQPIPVPQPIPQPIPQPYPQPIPQSGITRCEWFDGSSYGISTRGWHAYQVINGVTFSVGYYGNNGTESTLKCQKDVVFNIERASYSSIIQNAAFQNCHCDWNDGSTLLNRGWHMFFTFNLLTGGTLSLSSGYFENNGTASQEACNRQLVLNNFSCPIIQ